MPTRRCCCSETAYGCDIAADDFNRADSTNIGSQWTEHAGDWEIASNNLNVDEVGLVRNHAVSPYGTENQVVRAKIVDYAAGKKYRLVVQLNSAGTDYYYGEWHYVDASNMYFRLGSSSGVIAELGPETPIPEETECAVWVTEGGQLCMADTSSRMTECVTSKTGEYTGLAAGSSDGATFDDFAFEAHKTDNPTCTACDCSCDGWCVINELTGTFEEINECPGMDGAEVTLTNAGPSKFGDGWLMAAPVLCGGGLGGSENISIKLNCAGGSVGVEDFLMDIDAGGFDPVDGNPDYYYADPSVSTCSPLALRFGPFSYGNVSGCYNTMCCNGTPCDPAESTFYIWITE